MSLESRILDLEDAVSSLSKTSERTKDTIDAAILAVSGKGYVPAFSVLPYEDGYRMWCPKGTTFPAHQGEVPVIGADNDGWIHLGNQKGDVYCFVRKKSYVAEVQIGKPEEGTYDYCTMMARIGTD